MANRVLVLLAVVACGEVKSAAHLDAALEDRDAALEPDTAPDAPVCTANETTCGGTCAVLDDDPLHCGRCGHSCLGGTCTNGVCAQVVVAADLTGTSAVLADDTHIYWSTSSAISRRALDGGPVESVAGNQQGASDLARDATFLYWGTTTDLMRAPLAGGVAQSVSSVTGFKEVLADATGILFVDGSNQILRIPAGGGAAEPIASGQGTIQCRMASDGAHLYFSAVSQGVSRVLATSFANHTTAPVLTSLTNACSVALTTQHLYATNLTSSGTVVRANRDGTNVTPIVMGRSGPASIAVDDEFVYWSENGAGTSTPSAIMRAPLAGGAAVPLATFSRTNEGLAANVAVTDRGVFWVLIREGQVGKDRVMALAKP